MEEKFWHAEGQGVGKNLPLATKQGLSNSLLPAKPFARFNPQLLKSRVAFTGEEKLKSKKLIDQLFNEGKSVTKNGFTLVYLFTPIGTFYPAQAGFSVPKKHFKHAVDRNRIKRLMREAYRHQKFALYEKLVTAQKQVAVMWVYKGKQLPSLATAQITMAECLQKLAERI